MFCNKEEVAQSDETTPNEMEVTSLNLPSPLVRTCPKKKKKKRERERRVKEKKNDPLYFKFLNLFSPFSSSADMPIKKNF
jgi:hypothetical protein